MEYSTGLDTLNIGKDLACDVQQAPTTIVRAVARKSTAKPHLVRTAAVNQMHSVAGRTEKIRQVARKSTARPRVIREPITKVLQSGVKPRMVARKSTGGRKRAHFEKSGITRASIESRLLGASSASAKPLKERETIDLDYEENLRTSRLLKNFEEILNKTGRLDLSMMKRKIFSSCPFVETKFCHKKFSHEDQKIKINCCCSQPMIRLPSIRLQLMDYLQQLKDPYEHLTISNNAVEVESFIDDPPSIEEAVPKGPKPSTSTSDHQPSFPCRECNKKFRGSLLVIQHIRSFHQRQKKTKCVFCQEVHQEIQAHILRSHKDLTGCLDCNRSFPNADFPSHRCKMRTGKIKTFPCIQCPEVFNNSLVMIQHFRTSHQGHPRNQCIYCDKMRLRVSQHIAMVHKNNLVACMYCFEFFANKQSRARHDCSHEFGRRYKYPFKRSTS